MENNSAVRLWNILTDAQGVPADRTTQQALSRAFDIPDDNAPLLFRSLAIAEELILDVEQKVRTIEGADENLYLDWPARVRKVFTPLQIGARWEVYKGLIDKTDLKSIQFCAHLLAKHAPESAIAADDLKSILDTAQELENEIASSALPADLKSVLLDLVDRIRKAVREYKIRGAAGIKEALEAAVGAVDTHWKQIKRASRGGAPKDLFAKAFDWLRNIHLLVSIATQCQTALPAAIDRAKPLLKAAAAAMR